MDSDKLITRVDVMAGEQFERFVGWLLQLQNYRVQRVGTTLYRGRQMRVTGGYYQRLRDFGADLLAEKDGIRIAVQAKRCQRPVGPDAVKQVITAVKHYDCHQALVISNNTYTQTAVRLARRKKISLWDRDKLHLIIRENNCISTKPRFATE